MNKTAITLLIVYAALLVTWLIFDDNTSDDNRVLVEHSVDTVYSIPDTVLLIDTITVHKLTASLDTVYLDDTTKVVSASADTTLTKDSLNLFVQYFFPPLNYFEIDFDFPERIITDTIKIKEVKEFEKPIPFYKDNWFYSSIVLLVLLVFSITK